MSLREYSYGIVPLRKKGRQWQVLLIQHGRAKYWGFPKGHAEVGESPQKAAVRELLEETNLSVVRFFSESGIKRHYIYKLRGQIMNKTVWFFPAEVEGELQLQVQEVSDGIWLSFEEAVKKLTYPIDREICLYAAKLVGSFA